MASKRISRKTAYSVGNNDSGEEVGFEIDDFQDDYLDQLKSARNFPSSPNYQPSRSNKGRSHRASTNSNNNSSIATSATADAVVTQSSSRRSPRMDDGLVSDEDFDRQYDLSPLDACLNLEKQPINATNNKVSEQKMVSPPHGGGRSSKRNGPKYSIDPWEGNTPGAFPYQSDSPENSEYSDDYQGDDLIDGEDDYSDDDDDRYGGSRRGSNPTFLTPSDLHPNMLQREDDIAQLRLLAGKLNADWRGQDFMAPALARRIRDFQFAQEKRRKKYGDERPWGILGLYDHLAAIRVDVEWAEDAAWRRANGEPYLSWADFDASKNKGIHRPFFTYFLLMVCSVVLIISIALNGWIVEPIDVNPMIGPSAQTLIRMGAKDSYQIVNENEAWRLLSSAVLHAGLVHYFINTLALWFVGKAIETTHGMVAAAILFVIPAIGGTILSAIFLPQYITVGASGGIFGLIGACLSDIIMNWKLLFCDFVTENGTKHRHAMVVVFLLMDIALNCIIGLTPYVDNFTHLGGMFIGLLCGLSTMERLSSDFFGMEESCWSQTKQIIVRFLGLIISIIVVVITAVILLEGDGQSNPCPSCTWLSCVPFPPWESQSDKWWYCDDCGRVTAEIIQSPSLHLQLDCPDGTNVSVGLNADDGVDREKLERELPSYCREFCPEIDFRF